MAAGFSRDYEVRWGDQDAFAHVNNKALLAYIEEARVTWLYHHLPDLGENGSLPAVVNTNINFRRQLGYPGRVRVEIRAHLASERRVIHRYVIRDAGDEDIVYADAECTIVWFDPGTKGSTRVPGSLQQQLKGKQASHDPTD